MFFGCFFVSRSLLLFSANDLLDGLRKLRDIAAVQTLSPGSTAVLTLSGLPADGTVKLFILNSTTGEPLRRSWSSALQAA